MGVMIRSTNNIPRLTRVLRKLGKKTIKVGVFGADNYQYGNDADLVTIAYVHEFGTTIRPKTADWLTIPLIPAAKNKRASDFGDELFFYKPEGEDHAFLAREKGAGSNKSIENVFLLVKSVNIPERSFLRTGFDENVDQIAAKIESMLNDVLDFSINPEIFLDAIGMEFAGLIQRHMRRVSDPPNHPITKNVKGSSNPLQDTGRLIGSIRHEVE
jgi:hypothetical protein